MSHGPAPRPPINPLWPPVLLALALACVIAFVVAWRHNRAAGRAAGPPADLRRESGTVADRPAGDHRLTIEFLDVGQGDSALIRSPEGKTALVDAGPGDRVIGLLRARGIDRLDLAVVSHHHADHYGGMLRVVREFRPRVFLDAPSPQTSRAYEALLRAVRDQGITAIQPEDQPRKITLGSATLTILPQPPIDPHNENNNSIGLRVDFGDFAALLTGDSEIHERAWWSRKDGCPDLCGHVTILKLAHHGSRNGTSPAWLRLTRPELAVASLGANNEFGHPHPETLKYLRAADIPLRRTDRDGTVTITTDGATWAESSSTAEAPEPADAPWASGPAAHERRRAG